jgi:hypothetical protein
MPRIAKSENAGMGRKTAFMDGHYLTSKLFRVNLCRRIRMRMWEEV